MTSGVRRGRIESFCFSFLLSLPLSSTACSPFTLFTPFPSPFSPPLQALFWACMGGAWELKEANPLPFSFTALLPFSFFSLLPCSSLSPAPPSPPFATELSLLPYTQTHTHTHTHTHTAYTAHTASLEPSLPTEPSHLVYVTSLPSK